MPDDVVAAARRCRRLPWYDGGAAGALAGAEAMLEGLVLTGEPALRWSMVSTPALYLGASQKPDAADLPACRAAGVAVYKRAAGGNAVLAGLEMLGLDVALPGGDPLLLHDLTRSYQWLGEVWSAALRGLGVEAALVGIEEARANQHDPSEEARLARLACFGALSPFEVTVGGRKIVGLAQVRRRRGALFQAALLLRWAPARLSRLLAVPPGERAALTNALAARAVGLDAVALRPLTHDAIIAAVETALVEYGLVPADSAWSAEEQALAARLLDERYQPLDGA